MADALGMETRPGEGLADRQRGHALEAMSRYWPSGVEPVQRLPLARVAPPAPEPLPPRLINAPLPDWAADLAVEGGLLVPEAAVLPGAGEIWRRVDWPWAAFWFISGRAERAWEEAHGPAHSYTYRLRGWDERLWQRAWVNRMALFLRRWAAREQGASEETLLGRLPEAAIVLTHDVDAIRKTWAIRVKQGVFCLFNAVRLLADGRGSRAARAFARGLRFIFLSDDYWCFDKIMALEEARGLRSRFFFYAGGPDRGSRLQRALLDPSYDPAAPRLVEQLRRLRQGGWRAGLHGSYASWDDATALAGQREAVESAWGGKVTASRQHWLRFGWDATWRAQARAGIELDATLGFNDRPALRTGCAMLYRPWDHELEEPYPLTALPTVLMDSHLYDYRSLTPRERHGTMEAWIQEVRVTKGVAAVNWHQQVMGRDYGWADGYEELLDLLAARGIQAGPGDLS